MQNQITLLYVEDDKVVRENFVQIFESYFSTVLVTDNGDDALDIYNSNAIDVAILDISIPGINGLQLAQKIRETDNKIILFIISAHSEQEKLLKAINLRIFAYLVKPITLQEIDKSLKDMISFLSEGTLIDLSGQFFWNSTTKQLLYKNETIKLTKNESSIIEFFIQNKNIYFNSSEIQDQLRILKGTSESTSNTVVQIISRLKRKIMSNYQTDYFFIESCYGEGYRIHI